MKMGIQSIYCPNLWIGKWDCRGRNDRKESPPP